MEVLTNSTSVITTTHFISSKPQKPKTQLLQIPNSTLHFPISKNKFNLSSSSFTYCNITTALSSSTTTTTTSTSSSTASSDKRHWIVLMEAPKQATLGSKEEVLDYYVKTLETVLGSENDAQMCIYDASSETHFGFCCDIDEQASLQLSRLPGVLSVRPDPDFQSVKKNYDPTNVRSGYKFGQDFEPVFLFPKGTTKHWLVRMDKPGIGVVTKAQMVDHYAQILAKVLGNEKDAQMCIYHISWQSNFGFCCDLDEDCARELAGVPGVLSVQPDNNFGFENKDYGGSDEQSLTDSSLENESIPVKTRKLFITGLSFYTSEKTLRTAFEGFGELVEVRIIMDKISKRSKGYAFIEYTTEEAAGTALKEMNGKIINGWMIVVDAAKPRNSPPRGRARQY